MKCINCGTPLTGSESTIEADPDSILGLCSEAAGDTIGLCQACRDSCPEDPDKLLREMCGKAPEAASPEAPADPPEVPFQPVRLEDLPPVVPLNYRPPDSRWTAEEQAMIADAFNGME